MVEGRLRAKIFFMEHAHSAALRGLAHLLEKEPASHTASGQSNATAREDAGGSGVVGGGHSSHLFGLALLSDAANDFPCEVGPKLFARNAGVALDLKAVLGGHSVQSPLVDD